MRIERKTAGPVSAAMVEMLRKVQEQQSRLRRMWPKSSIYQHVQQKKLRAASPTPGKVLEGLTSWEVFTGKRVALIT